LLAESYLLYSICQSNELEGQLNIWGAWPSQVTP